MTTQRQVSKDEYEIISQAFRNEACRDPIAKMTLHPEYEYKKVIYTYDKEPNRVERYESMGWEIVIEEKEGRLSPIIGVMPKSGHKYVLMRCKITQRNINEQQKDKRDKEAIARSVKRTEIARGNQTKITYPEINETNINNPETFGE